MTLGKILWREMMNIEERMYDKLCRGCPKEKECHDNCEHCDNFYEATTLKPYKKLSHPEKMEIYNLHNGHLHLVKEICEITHISSRTYYLVIKEIQELIDREIYGKHIEKPTTCNLCGGKVIFNKCDKAKSKSGFVYWCSNCHAWVGTRPDKPTIALGQLANAKTRGRRIELHKWFDKLWKNHEERKKYYDQLSLELGIQGECHFSQMNDEQMDRAETIIKKWWFEKYDR